MKATIRSIADLAGVSKTTAERALKDLPGVNIETRKRIMKIAQEVGYTPNIIGRALAKNKAKIRIGAILPISDVAVKIKEGMEVANREFKDFGFEILFKFVEDFNIEEHIRAVQEFRRSSVQALIVRPFDDDTLIREINLFADEKENVVTYNSNIEEINSLCYVGQNDFQSGETAADLLAKLLATKGDIVIISGLQQLLCLKQRIEGFKSVIAGHKDMRIVDIISNKEVEDEVYQKTYRFFSENQNIQGIYVSGGTGKCIEAIGTSLNETNLCRKVKLVCCETYAETVKLLKEGIIDFTISHNLYYQGYFPVKVIFNKIMYGLNPENRIVTTDIVIRTKMNVL
jgi:LacI family transcriptional regulator